MILRPWFWSLAVLAWLLTPFALSGLSETKTATHMWVTVFDSDK
jgi:hypothetical protein